VHADGSKFFVENAAYVSRVQVPLKIGTADKSLSTKLNGKLHGITFERN
jgi:hypothetical protein